ncbi:hypothetical protein DFH09DRAFT_1215975 [Mycena vulgaris]|nr:hypothetical protein DFH09DRAFT_1215975 [Mycena vulgaris]
MTVLRLLLVLFTMWTFVGATPFAGIYPRDAELPKDATHLSYDDQKGEITAYKGATVLGTFPAPAQSQKRTTGSCVPVSSAEVQALPGWSKLNAAADDAWGTGSRNIVTNPPEYLWGPANGCTESTSVVSVDSSKLSCNVVNVTDKTEWDNAKGTGTTTLTTGLDQTTSYTVTQENSIGIGSSITATVGVPDVESLSATLSTQVTFTNTQSKGTEKTDSKSVSSAHAVSGSSGQTCTVISAMKSCTIPGTVNVRTIVTGYVWFNYNDQTATKDAPNDKHFKWALSIENTLKNVDDHSGTMVAQTSTSGSTNTNTYVTCGKTTTQIKL